MKQKSVQEKDTRREIERCARERYYNLQMKNKKKNKLKGKRLQNKQKNV